MAVLYTFVQLVHLFYTINVSLLYSNANFIYMRKLCVYRGWVNHFSKDLVKKMIENVKIKFFPTHH